MKKISFTLPQRLLTTASSYFFHVRPVLFVTPESGQAPILVYRGHQGYPIPKESKFSIRHSSYTPHHSQINSLRHRLTLAQDDMVFQYLIWETADVPILPKKRLNPLLDTKDSLPTSPGLGTLGILPLEIRLVIWNLFLQDCSENLWPCRDESELRWQYRKCD